MGATLIAKGLYGIENVEKFGKLKTIKQYRCRSDNRTIDRKIFIQRLIDNNIPFTEKLESGHTIKRIEVKDPTIRFYFKTKKIKGELKTSVFESAQTYMCTYLSKYPLLQYKNFNIYEFQNVFPHGSVELEKIINLLNSEEEWKKTAFYTAKCILEYLYNSDYEFHRNSSEVQSIYYKYNLIKQNAGLISSKDKWNPSDIWAFKPGFKLKLNQCSIDELNTYILENAYNGNLIGISLKKLGTTYEPIIQKFNFTDEVEEVNFDDISYRYSKEPYLIFKSKDTYINASGIKIQFRSKLLNNVIQGQIQGKNSMHGGIGLAQIFALLETDKPKKLNEINTKNIKLFIDELKQQKISSDNIDLVDEKELLFQLGILNDNVRIDRFNSKYQSIYTINRIDSESLKDIYLYASCQRNKLITPSAFIKVF